MKELLIIRSVSMQQLDNNLVDIQKSFPDYRIGLLTHEHSQKLAEKYKMIDQVYVYPFKGSFRFRDKVRELSKRQFDAVIVPVSNLTGAGFFNVFLFSLSIKARKRFVCNMVSKVKPISPLKIFWLGSRHVLFSVIAFLFTVVTGIIALLLLPLLLKRIKK